MNSTIPAGETAYTRIKDLFPICRSLTGEGVRQTLAYMRAIIPELEIKSLPGGKQVFDWEVPPEWVIRSGYIEGPDGQRIVDFADHNLHVIGYSEAVDKTIPLEELQQHLYSLPAQPDAIPYITSYYKRRWGFCLTHNQRQSLKPGNYRVFIDSEFKADGELNYAELIIKGKSSKEILLSTYICHPSMANNELSGPAVTLALAEWLRALSAELNYTYRIVFIPETIGAIAYIHENLGVLKENVVAGYVVTCVGDDRAYSFMPTPWEDTANDELTIHILDHEAPEYKRYSFLQRGSDERQYCSPNVGLPVVSVMRSKYHEYPEYHTSLDNLDFVSAKGLQGGIEILQKCLQAHEINSIYKSTVTCEPMLSKRGLYSDLGHKSGVDQKLIFDFLAFADGRHDALSIARKMGVCLLDLAPAIRTALKFDLVRRA